MILCSTDSVVTFEGRDDTMKRTHSFGGNKAEGARTIVFHCRSYWVSGSKTTSYQFLLRYLNLLQFLDMQMNAHLFYM